METDFLKGMFFIVAYFIVYFLVMTALIIACFWWAWRGYPFYATCAGVPGFYLAWKAIRSFRW